MAPEQVRGDKNAGAPSDLYALGCLIHQLLTGTAPFTGPSWHILHQHLHETPTPLSTLRPNVPRELEHLVLELLDKDPARRPTAANTLDRLTQLHSALAAIAAAPTATPHRPHVPTVVDTPHAAGRRRGLGPRTTALWAGAVTAAALAGELAWTTTLPSPWPTTIGTLGGILLSTLYLLDPPQPTRPGELRITTAGLLAALLLASGTAVALPLLHPTMWWAEIATAVLGGPLLVACSSAVRRTVQHMLQRPSWHADLASTAGALHTTTLLLAAGHAGSSGFTMLAAGLVLWPATALITAIATSRRTRDGHAERAEPARPGRTAATSDGARTRRVTPARPAVIQT
ncbi:protein kinase domain-containing protein [Streptomyces sp. XH2]|uniref:protein kinase domain-containing protein n=1 Tax=Streptomyces sp. XH2 TaxID=3412483 RepID=UPI003C7C204F